MLVKFDIPGPENDMKAREVWLHAEDIDRIEGFNDWKLKETVVYLKRNPDVPFLTIKKAICKVVDPVNLELERQNDSIDALTKAVDRLIDVLLTRKEQ